MEISLKVQNIGANYNPDAKDIVITHEFDVPSEQMLDKRGRLFITLKISASGDFNLKDTASLFLDSVQENFYRLTEETPLHSLEKALNRATKLVLTMKSKDETISLGSVEANFKLNFATALIWNRILYTSYFGVPAVYLVRGTGVRNLSLNPATNELWTNSGILDDQDVIIIGTDKFAKTFPANEIINSLGNISQTIAAHPDKDELAALLIKVSTTEKQNQNASNKNSDSKLRAAIYTSFWNLKSKFADNEKLSDRFKFYQNKKTAPVSSISGLTTPATTSATVNMPKSPKRASSAKNSKKAKKRATVGLAMVAVLTLIGYKIFSNPQEHIANDIQSNISFIPSSKPLVMGASTSPELAAASEMHPVLMDLNNLGETPTITGLSTTLDKIIVLDASGKKLYSINPETKESKSIFEDFEESALPQFLECDLNYCYLGDSNKFYILKPTSPEKVDDYLPGLNGIIDMYPYSSSLYFLTKNQIYTYPIDSTTTDKTVAKEWLAADQTLNNARSMLIDNGSVYVITNSEVIKFANKKRDTSFKLDFSRVSNPITMETAGGKLYVLDVSDQTKAIQIFNKTTGEYLQTIELTKDNQTPKIFTLPKYAKGKLLFEENKVLHEVTL
jgi:hypothetical protein